MIESCGIAVMAKASASGRTKTRLVPPLTSQEAASINTAFLQDIAANLLRARDRGADIAPYMAYGPIGSSDFFETHLPPSIGRFECWFENFGDCLSHAISEQLRKGHRSACVLNADSPTLPSEILIEAARTLAEEADHIVLGPSDDGGYYLLGMRTLHQRLFEDIAWSTEHVFDQTLERAREAGLKVHLLPTWYDVDDWSSLTCLIDEIFNGEWFDQPLEPHDAAASRAYLKTLLDHHGLADRMRQHREFVAVKTSATILV